MRTFIGFHLSVFNQAGTNPAEHNFQVMRVENKKDHQRETLTIEIVAWVILFGAIYLLAKVIL